MIYVTTTHNYGISKFSLIFDDVEVYYGIIPGSVVSPEMRYVGTFSDKPLKLFVINKKILIGYYAKRTHLSVIEKVINFSTI